MHSLLIKCSFELCVCVCGTEIWWCLVCKRLTSREHLCRTFRFLSTSLSKCFCLVRTFFLAHPIHWSVIGWFAWSGCSVVAVQWYMWQVIGESLSVVYDHYRLWHLSLTADSFVNACVDVCLSVCVSLCVSHNQFFSPKIMNRCLWNSMEKWSEAQGGII